MYRGVCKGYSNGCRAALLLTVGFFVGILLNQFGFLFENIHVDVKITVVESDINLLTSQHLPQYALQQPSESQPSNYVVPNIVHFIWFTDDDAGKRRMTFVDYMSILSVYRIQQPDEIQFHCSRLPDVEDVWWSRVWKEIPLKIVFHEKSALIGQLKLTREQKQFCKLSAIKVLLEQGGIFIDWSVLVIKNLNPIRQHNVTLGKESPSTLSTDVVAARQNATFLRILIDSHGVDAEPCDVDRSAYNLSLKHPTLLNTVPFPEAVKSQLSWHRVSETAAPYVVRLTEAHRSLWDSSSPESIKAVNGTIGKALRYIYYGYEFDY